MGVYARFADLLEYPGDGLDDRVARCIAEVGDDPRDAVPALERFRDAASCLPEGRLEEAYTASFDLDPAATLYVGHHLFGEDRRRALFLCRLAGEYRESEFALSSREAPDHLAVMLRYLDAPGVASTAREDLIAEAVLPAATRIREALEKAAHPYAPLFDALLAVIARNRAAPVGAAGAMV